MDGADEMIMASRTAEKSQRANDPFEAVVRDRYMLNLRTINS
jgi:hypothetical protein